MHPLQLKVVVEKPFLNPYIHEAKLTYLPHIPSQYTPTSSFRTICQKDSPYILKFSLPLKITNSLPLNKQNQLHPPLHISPILKTQLPL
ncbi:IucA/IucC family protein, partial [Bacillus pumilus]|uniref:IucA/IucC family protein n=1 Tax=Bacillus pumilus TaxID=1408 RepID=UPI0021B49D9E